MKRESETDYADGVKDGYKIAKDELKEKTYCGKSYNLGYEIGLREAETQININDETNRRITPDKLEGTIRVNKPKGFGIKGDEFSINEEIHQAHLESIRTMGCVGKPSGMTHKERYYKMLADEKQLKLDNKIAGKKKAKEIAERQRILDVKEHKEKQEQEERAMDKAFWEGNSWCSYVSQDTVHRMKMDEYQRKMKLIKEAEAKKKIQEDEPRKLETWEIEHRYQMKIDKEKRENKARIKQDERNYFIDKLMIKKPFWRFW